MLFESRLLDAYRSANLGKLNRLISVLRIREDLTLCFKKVSGTFRVPDTFLKRLLVCVWIVSGFPIGCNENHRTGSQSLTAVIVGSSMEPTLLGPQRLAQCKQCQSSMRFSDGADVEDNPPPCPRCGSKVELVDFQAAQTVKVHPIDRKNASVRRGELVAIQDRELERWEVKRVVGFPRESIQIVNGDIWVDGRRFQKSISQFASLAIEVDRWNEIEGLHVTVRGRSPTEKCFASNSLWPRTGEQLEPTPSPILDEYRCNARESRELVVVRDIGVHCTFPPGPIEPARIEVRIWYEGVVRSLLLDISADGVRILAPSSLSKEPSFRFDLHLPSLIVAVVDGRLLVGSEQSGHALDINEFQMDSQKVPSSCSAVKPISLTVLDGQASIKQAFIVRDIHYRGKNGETEWELPSVAGYHLLGDNVSNSSDSRDRWPDGVLAESIIGRVEAATN
jgi:Signal peptidase, peptidase S26